MKKLENHDLERAIEFGVKETAELLIMGFGIAADVRGALADGKVGVGEGISIVVGNFSIAKAGLTGLQTVDDELKQLTVPGREFLASVVDTGLAEMGATHRNRDICREALAVLHTNVEFAIKCFTRPPTAQAA